MLTSRYLAVLSSSAKASQACLQWPLIDLSPFLSLSQSCFSFLPSVPYSVDHSPTCNTLRSETLLKYIPPPHFYLAMLFGVTLISFLSPTHIIPVVLPVSDRNYYTTLCVSHTSVMVHRHLLGFIPALLHVSAWEGDTTTCVCIR